MPLTNAEEIALRRILADAADNGLDPRNFDPQIDPRIYLKGLVQAARTKLADERAGLPALNTKLLNQIAVLDGLLAKFPV